ncbi:MAG TPA: hypothetical protein VLE91_03900 [Candidatus Saccharimonadales bacterium]|nr:hypothetical protein [Candidatus Saccharimonadales bacterium]
MPTPKFGFASPKVAKIAAMLAKKGKIGTHMPKGNGSLIFAQKSLKIKTSPAVAVAAAVPTKVKAKKKK